MRFLIDASAARKSGALTDYLGLLPSLGTLIAEDEGCVLGSAELLARLNGQVNHLQLTPMVTDAGLSRYVALNTSVKRQIAAYDPDIVLFTLFSTITGCKLPYSLRFTNAVLVDPAYRPCLRFISLTGRIAHIIRRLNFYHSARNARAVICSTQSAADLLLRYVPGLSKEQVIASHFGPPLLNGSGSRHSPPGTRRLLTMHLMPHKNVELILSALTHPLLKDWSLSVLADLNNPRTRYEKFLKQRIVELNLTERVHSLGFLADQKQVERRLLEHDILVVPSHTETWSHPVLEGLAIGMPVIASDIPTHQEVAQGAAWLVDPNDVEALVATVCQVADDTPEVENRIETGFEIISRLSWKEHAATILQTLRRVATA